MSESSSISNGKFKIVEFVPDFNPVELYLLNPDSLTERNEISLADKISRDKIRNLDSNFSVHSLLFCIGVKGSGMKEEKTQKSNSSLSHRKISFTISSVF